MTLFLLTALLVQTPTTAPADRIPQDTSEIGGRVTDAETGRPIARAIVHLTRLGGSEPASARTDDQGHYRFKGLVPGRYSGLVNAGEFSAAYQIAPLAPGGSALVLAEGEVRDHVDVALRRALGINVRVVNEWGQPLAGVRVSGHVVDGRQSLHASMANATDDRGRLRLFRVTPGRYIVCTEPLLPGGDVNAATRERYLKTCYPSAASEADAEAVVVERADADIEIRMRRGRTFTISGTVLDASGMPAPQARVSLEISQRDGSTGVSTNVDAAGRFTIANMAPGDYALSAALGGDQQPELRRELARAFVALHVDADLEDLRVSMVKTVDVAGRIVAEGATPTFKPQEGSAPIFISARRADVHLPNEAGAQHGYTTDDRTFILVGLFGRRILDVANVPRGWYVKSIRYRGDEILDVPVEFKAGTDPSELQVILSNRGATVSGRVLDVRGEAVAKARLLLVPGDPARRTRFQQITATSTAEGTFRLGPVRAGEYFVVALPSSAEWPDPRDVASLKRLTDAAERVTLGDDEQRTLDIRVAMPDPRR